MDVARHRGASGGFLLDRHEASGAVAVTASRSTDTPTALGGAGKSAAARRNHIATLAAAAANSRGNPRRGFDWAQPVVDRVRQCLYRDLDRCCGAHLNTFVLTVIVGISECERGATPFREVWGSPGRHARVRLREATGVRLREATGEPRSSSTFAEDGSSSTREAS